MTAHNISADAAWERRYRGKYERSPETRQMSPEIFLYPFGHYTSSVFNADIRHIGFRLCRRCIAGYIIKSCEEQWRQPSRDAKSCVSRATNTAITAISSLQLIAQPYVSRTTNVAMTATSSPHLIVHPYVSRATNVAITATSSPQFISHPCLWDAKFCVSTFCRLRYKRNIFIMP